MAESLNTQQLKEAIKKVDEKIDEYRSFESGLQGADGKLTEKIQGNVGSMRWLQTGLMIAAGEMNLAEALDSLRVSEIEDGEEDFCVESHWWNEFKDHTAKIEEAHKE